MKIEVITEAATVSKKAWNNLINKMKKKDTRPDPFPILLKFPLSFIQEFEKIDKGKLGNRTRKNWMETTIMEKVKELKNKK